jgi:signal peptide peptidase SppA
MKIDPVLSQIFRHKWAIDPQYAFQQGPIIDGFLKGNMLDRSAADMNVPSALSNDKKVLTYCDWDVAPNNSIAQINLKGELMKSSQFCGPMGMEVIGKRVIEADNDDRFKGILLVIDSPGGTVDGTEVLANIIRNTKKPVLAYVDGLMASAAAWIGTGADEIWTSTDTDEVGSIGVLMSFADVQPYYERMGVKFHLITASTSENKVKMFEDIRAGKYKEYQEEVLDVLDEKFMNAVKQSRPKVTREHLSGKVFFARDVMGALVDQVGTLEQAVERLYEMSKTKSAEIVAEQEEETDESQITINANKKMENLSLIIAALGVTSIELDEEGFASFNEEQLTALESALQSATAVKAKLEGELQTAQSDLQAEQDARNEDTQTIADLRDANANLRSENDSLKNAASGGSSKAITKGDATGEDKKDKKPEGVVTSEDNDFMTNLNLLEAELKG